MMARSFFLPPRHPMPHLIESSSQGLVCERVLSPYLPPRRGDHATVRPLLAAIGAVDARVAGIRGGSGKDSRSKNRRQTTGVDPNRASLCDRGDLPSCALPQPREDVVARGTIGKIHLKKGEECESLLLRQPIRIPSGSFKIFSMQQHIDEPAIGLYNDRWQPQLQPFRRHRVKLAIPS